MNIKNYGKILAASLLVCGLGTINAQVTINGVANQQLSGTPTAPFTLTNGTGLPISTGLTGAGTGVITALGNAINASGGLATSASPTFTGTPDASGASQFKLPVGAGYTTAANGELGYDSTNKNWHMWANGVDVFNATFATSGITTGHCAQFTNSTGTWTLTDAGAACASGSGTITSSTASYVSYYTGATTINGAAGFSFNGTGTVSIGTTSVVGTLTIFGSGTTGATSLISGQSTTGTNTLTMPTTTGTIFESAGTDTAASGLIFDLSPATGSAAFKVPSTTTNTASAAGVIDYDTTNSNYHANSGADSILGLFPTASVPATGDVIDASVTSSKVLLHDSGVATANLATAASNITNHVIIQGNGTKGLTGGNGDFTIDSTAHTLLSGAAGLVDFSAITATTGFKIPSIAGAGSTTADTITYDSTNNRITFGNGTSNFILPWFTTGTVTSGHMVTWNGTLGGLQDGGVVPTGTITSSTSGQIPVYTGATTIAGSANFTIATGALTLGASGTVGSIALGNATSGTVIINTVTGALGSVTASLSAQTGTIAMDNENYVSAATIGTASYAATLQPNALNTYQVGICATACALTLTQPSAPIVGQQMTINICQAASGAAWTVTWPSTTFIRSHMTIGTVQTAGSNCSIQTFIYSNFGGSPVWFPTGTAAINQ